MQRRKFLLGVGSTAAAGSAILGSGAFSRVEAQRSMTIEVAEDPNAYLGMDKCRIDGSTTPNSSYAHLDENGHLQILMNEENPTIGESPLGEGINSDSRMWVDNVFQLCNQGKEDVCIWIEDHDDWPTAPEEYDEERRVDFYLGSDRDRSIVGEENAVGLPLGECICLGLKTNSKGLSEGDELLEELDNEIRIVADVDGLCFTDPEDQCPIYGITQGTGEQEISAIPIPSVDEPETITSLAGFDEEEEFYPNALAFDSEEGNWYFTTAADGDGAMLHRYDGFGFEEVGVIADNNVAGAAWYSNGHFYFVENGTSELKRVDDDGDVEDVGDLGVDAIGLGDVAIEQFNGTTTAYISTSQTEGGARFIEVDLSDPAEVEPGDVTVIADEDDGDTVEDSAINKQIAFGPDEELWAHQAGSDLGAINGNWYTVDLSDGSTELEAERDVEYTDLAQCAFPPAFTDRS